MDIPKKLQQSQEVKLMGKTGAKSKGKSRRMQATKPTPKYNNINRKAGEK